MSEDDFFNFCTQNRDTRMERDSNQNIYITSPTGGISGNCESKLNQEVANWNDINQDERMDGQRMSLGLAH